MTVLGTRPEIIRLSLVIRLLDRYCDHILVHTGQNHDPRLSEVFFQELEVRRPDVHLMLDGPAFGKQVGSMLGQIEEVFQERRPDRLLILGDTNSGLSALPARRMGIPVYHMEAGNRCWDDRVPEEINRRVIDHASSVLMPYTHNSKENLLAEGIHANRIYVTGNPIFQVIEEWRHRIDSSKVLAELKLERGKFFLVTLHRAENVDSAPRLKAFMSILEGLAEQYELPVICSVHPRTRAKLQAIGRMASDEESSDGNGEQVRLIQPFGFFDFVHLEQHAYCVLSDSGTVQEECAILGSPNVTLRDVTERPETIESGSNALGGADPDRVRRLVELAVETAGRWQAPAEYLAPSVAETAARIVLGYRHEETLIVRDA